MRKAIAEAGIPTNEVIGDLSSLRNNKRHEFLHAAPTSVHQQSLLTFAFVRHPLLWYRSFWAFQKAMNWSIAPDWVRDCQSSDFQEFTENFLAKKPSYVTHLYRKYVGLKKSKVHFIGRQETLVDDLVRVLQRAGEAFDEQKLRSIPPVNTRQWGEEPTISTELQDLVYEQDREVYDVFGYQKDILMQDVHV